MEGVWSRVVQIVQPALEQGWSMLPSTLAAVGPALQQAAAAAQSFTDQTNRVLLAILEPWEIAVVAAFVAVVLARASGGVDRTWRDKGWKQVLSALVLDLPGIRHLVQREQAKIAEQIRRDLRKKRPSNGDAPLAALPERGTPAAEVRRRLQAKAREDVKFEDGSRGSRVSGTVYIQGEEHKALLNDAHALFSLSNPMHADVFPSARRMEGEVVAMTAAMLGGGPDGDPGVCGAMTSGGTESILTAVKASRDYMAATRGITQPEMVVAVSAHAAFTKAAEYFRIRLVRVPVGKDYRLAARAVARAVGRNTVLVVASAPGFPHGVVDHVEDIAKVTSRRGIPLHVDCCLGGFVLPFVRALGHAVPRFDFSVPGVTSISADTHKFGMAHKGTSVVLYRSAAIRRYQYTSITDWTGGLYISPGFAGSRSGALIATAWASLVHLGREGLLAATARLMALAGQLQEGLAAVPGLEVMGSPEMCVVAFKSTRRDLDIYRVNDLVAARGWHLNALQHPAALHVCLTAAHSEAAVAALLADVRESVAEVLAAPKGKAGAAEGKAPLYGMAAAVPDRRIVGQFLIAYQDALLDET